MPSFKIFAGHVFVVKNVGFVDYFVVIFITPLELLPVELLSFGNFRGIVLSYFGIYSL